MAQNPRKNSQGMILNAVEHRHTDLLHVIQITLNIAMSTANNSYSPGEIGRPTYD